MAANRNNVNVAGSVFVGCILIGTAIGMITNHTAIGSIIGVGVGFFATAAVRSRK